MLTDTNKMIIESRLTRLEALEKIKHELKSLCTRINQSVVIQSEHIYKRAKKLIVFDVESTLIQISSLRNLLKKIEGNVTSTESMFEFILKKLETGNPGPDLVCTFTETLETNQRRRHFCLCWPFHTFFRRGLEYCLCHRSQTHFSRN